MPDTQKSRPVGPNVGIGPVAHACTNAADVAGCIEVETVPERRRKDFATGRGPEAPSHKLDHKWLDPSAPQLPIRLDSTPLEKGGVDINIAASSFFGGQHGLGHERITDESIRSKAKLGTYCHWKSECVSHWQAETPCLVRGIFDVRSRPGQRLWSGARATVPPLPFLTLTEGLERTLPISLNFWTRMREQSCDQSDWV